MSLQAVEEAIMHRDYPITYAIIKNASPKDDGLLPWVKWYAIETVGKDATGKTYCVVAQVGWIPNKEKDQIIGEMTTLQLAEDVAATHNSVLYDVQQPGFGKKGK
jgi:hypothetical protein